MEIELQKAYFRQRGIQLMNSIERESHTLMHEIDTLLEKSYWLAVDQDDLKGLKRVVRKLEWVFDSITMDHETL